MFQHKIEWRIQEEGEISPRNERKFEKQNLSPTSKNIQQVGQWKILWHVNKKNVKN